MRKLLFYILVCCGFTSMAQPVRLHPGNPHYFEYKDKPLVLIASGLHYGAVLNLDINYEEYLKTLDQYGFNLHREFIIPCYEWQPEDKWDQEQTPLSPRPGKLLSPYARSSAPGARDSLNRYDLDKWNQEYFDHLKDFCRKADDRGIIVEIVMFTVLYGEGAWETNPLNTINNIQGVGNGKYNDYTFIGDPLLLERQKQLVRKTVTELNEFDNVYFEICNEPYWAKGIPGGNPEIKEQHFLPEVNDWQAVLAGVIAETEQDLPKKHLIAQNLANTYYKIDTLCHPSVSVLNYHYAFPPNTVPDNYSINLPVCFDETANGCNAPDRRIEAWAFLLAGGAVYNNLDWSFAIDDQTGRGRNPAGRRRSGVEVKQQLSVLKHFMDTFDFIRAKPIEPGRIRNMPEKVLWYGLENKEVLTIYFLKQTGIVIPKALLEISPGNYELTWIDPIDGSIIRKIKIINKENSLPLEFPDFPDDLLLSLKRI
ncbi:MAG TPA: DUF6298 domain-containing protein [Bacteroidales bacterium]|nr:DUF6298 domain-containing protein [Bacteroidales bacterium]